MAITTKELARLAGVSTATVSRAFSEKDYVNRETRERILKLAEEQGFSPRGYKRRKNVLTYKSCIGVVVPDIGNAYYTEVIHGIENVMEESGIQVLICNSDERSGTEIRILDMLSQISVSGIIISPVSNTVEYNADYLLELNRSGTPVVLIDRDLRGGNLDGVFMSNYRGAYQSIQTFIDQGHRNIAFISGPTTSTSGLDRLNAYLAALRDNGLPVREEYILYGDFKFESAYELTKKLVDRHGEVTAIFSSNRRMSSGCLMALAERHLEVGRDMAFISCGKVAVNNGEISFVDYPTVDIGEECARILLEKFNQSKKSRSTPKKRITFDMELVLRGSERFPDNRERPGGAHSF